MRLHQRLGGDDDLRDARSGRGDDARRPHRRAQRAACSSRSARRSSLRRGRRTCFVARLPRHAGDELRSTRRGARTAELADRLRCRATLRVRWASPRRGSARSRRTRRRRRRAGRRRRAPGLSRRCVHLTRRGARARRARRGGAAPRSASACRWRRPDALHLFDRRRAALRRPATRAHARGAAVIAPLLALLAARSRRSSSLWHAYRGDEEKALEQCVARWNRGARRRQGRAARAARTTRYAAKLDSGDPARQRARPLHLRARAARRLVARRGSSRRSTTRRRRGEFLDGTRRRRSSVDGAALRLCRSRSSAWRSSIEHDARAPRRRRRPTSWSKLLKRNRAPPAGPLRRSPTSRATSTSTRRSCIGFGGAHLRRATASPRFDAPAHGAVARASSKTLAATSCMPAGGRPARW